MEEAMESVKRLEEKFAQEEKAEEERFAAKFRVWCKTSSGMANIKKAKDALIAKGVGARCGGNA